MFREGDVAICINSKNKYYSTFLYITELKKYKVLRHIISDDLDMILISNDLNKMSWYEIDRFLLLEEFRKLKINKIRNGIQKRRHDSLYK